MPKFENDRGKVRVQLDLSAKEIERVNWMMTVCDLNTRKELFNNALSLMEWAVKEVTGGHRIASFNDDTKERVILSMPALAAAESHGFEYDEMDDEADDREGQNEVVDNGLKAAAA